MDIEQTIRKFIEENLIVLEEDVTFSNSDNIFELGYVNSLFAMKMLNFIETEYSIVIENDDMDISNFSSVNNIISLIEKKTTAV